MARPTRVMAKQARQPRIPLPRQNSAMGSAEAVVVSPRALVAFTAGAANLALTELRWRKGGEEGQSRRRAKI